MSKNMQRNIYPYIWTRISPWIFAINEQSQHTPAFIFNLPWTRSTRCYSCNWNV